MTKGISIRRELEPIHLHEKSGLLTLDTCELFDRNPAAFIPNPSALSQMEAYFSENLFNRPIDVAKVQVAPNQVVYLVIDGHTRLAYAAGVRSNDIDEDSPRTVRFDTVRTQDVTAEYLANPYIVGKSGAHGRYFLTLEQWAMAALAPVNAHIEIADERTALGLFTVWRSIAGDQLAQEFPLAAALSLLLSLGTRGDNPYALATYLKQTAKTPIMIEETKEKRARLIQALERITTIVRYSHAKVPSVAVAAYRMIGDNAIIIGGTKEARRQAYGLARSPQVQQKLEMSYGKNNAHIEQSRIQIADAIQQALGRFSGKNDKTHRDNLIAALDDTRLTVKQTVRVLRHEDPSTAYWQEITQSNRTALEAAYRRQIHSTAPLSDAEETLINSLGQTPDYVAPDQREHLVFAIKRIVDTVTRAENFETHLRNKVHTQTGKGIPQKVIDAAITQAKTMIDDAKQAVYASSRGTLEQKISALENTFPIAEDAFIGQINQYIVGVVVDKQFGSIKSEERALLIVCVLRETGNLSDTDRAQRVIASLQTLRRDAPEDYRRVLDDRLTLQTALHALQADLQAEANRITLTPIAKPPTQKTKIEIKLSPDRPTVTIPPVYTQAERARRRSEANTAELLQLLADFTRNLRRIDLQPENVNPAVAAKVLETIQALAEIIGFPDIVAMAQQLKIEKEEEARRRRIRIVGDQATLYEAERDG